MLLGERLPLTVADTDTLEDTDLDSETELLSDGVVETDFERLSVGLAEPVGREEPDALPVTVRVRVLKLVRDTEPEMLGVG